MPVRVIEGVPRISEVERSGTMMAWGRRTSIARGSWGKVLPPIAAGIFALCSYSIATLAQQVEPAPQAAPAPKQAAKKSKPKPAAEEAKAVKKDPAVAQQQIDAGTVALQAGKHDQAVQQFTSALTGGSLPANLMARAHYQRGLAYRKQSKPALAISDLTHALWIKNGLTEADRADAMQNRIAAYRDAGLPDQVDSEGSKSPSVASGASAKSIDAVTTTSNNSTPARTGSIPSEKPSAGLAPTPEAAPAPSGGGVGAFFGNLFGGSNSTAEAAPAPAPKTEPATSAWSAGTEIKTPAGTGQKIRPAGQTASIASAGSAPLPWQQPEPPAARSPGKTASAAPAAAVAVKTGARFALQVAQLKSREEAQTMAAQLKQELGADLAGREPSITAVSAGGFGTLHRLSFGPFSDAAEWKELCPKLLKAGHDCQPLKQ